jgi:hypothetical protein
MTTTTLRRAAPEVTLRELGPGGDGAPVAEITYTAHLTDSTPEEDPMFDVNQQLTSVARRRRRQLRLRLRWVAAPSAPLQGEAA